MSKLVLLISLFLVSYAHADVVQIEKDYNDCMEKAGSNNAMKQCVFAAYDQSDLELNRVYNSIKDPLLKLTDADSKEILKRLVTSERAWIKVRDADCSLLGTDMLGGSGEGLIIGECLYRKTTDRISFLTSIFPTH